MRQLKTEDLIKILPLQESTKTNLLNTIKTADESTLYDMQKVLWKHYFILEEELTNLKYEQFFEEVRDGKRQISSGLFEEAKEAVLNDFEDVLSGKKQEVDQMDQIRAKLQSLGSNNTSLVSNETSGKAQS